MQEFEKQIGAETLRVQIYSKDPARKANLAYIHGAGKLGMLYFPYSQLFTEQGFSVLNFQFSGCGKSSGVFEKSSLAKRTAEAKAMLENYADPENFNICAASMGGHIALRLLQYFKPKSLVLLCPGIYDLAAFDLPFDSGFTKAIRKPESWRNSEVLELLRRYTGKLLVFIGDDDQVIPKGVIELLDKNSLNTAKKEIINLPNCPHNIYLWLRDNPKYERLVLEKIAEFIR